MLVGLGSKKFSELDVQYIIERLTVWMAVLAKRAKKIQITKIEVMPPDTV